jgi:hypothetical protein
MKLSYIALLSVTAASLTAQTLSFGEITLVTPATTPPTRVVNVVLASSGGQIAGLQFDLNYDPTQLNVTVAVAGTAAAASKEASTTTLPAQYNPSTSAPVNSGPGQRVIVTGVGMSDTSVSSTGGPSIIADGSVATLTIQPTGSATTTGQTLTLKLLAATTAGGTNIPAAPVTLNIGAGSNDAAGTGTLNLYPTYLVGDVTPAPSNAAPNFGTGALNALDIVQVLFTADKLTAAPPTCSDLFDAMDTSPVDTATARGGDGQLTVLDIVEELFRADNLDTSRPVRVSRGEVCTGSETSQSMARNSRVAPRPQPENYGLLQFGTSEPVAGGERVPVYLQAGRDMARMALTFGVGDQQSQLHFVSAGDVAPSLAVDSQVGVLALAWLEGLNVPAGRRLLLGYITGPAGYAANLKVFGVSAAGLNDRRDVSLDVSGAAIVQQ